DIAEKAEHLPTSGARFWHRCPGTDTRQLQTRRSWGNSFHEMRETRTRASRHELLGDFPGVLPGRRGCSTRRLSWLFRGDGDGNSQPNTDGYAASATIGRSAVPRWEQERPGGRADDGLRRWSRG